MRADRKVRWRHARRLRKREVGIKRALLAAPAVAAALSFRGDQARYEVALLAALKTQQLRAANVGRTEWEERAAAVRVAVKAGDRSVTLKSLGKPPALVRGSAFTKPLDRARRKVELMAEGMNPGSSQQKAWLLYEVFGLPVQRSKDTGQVTTDKKALARLARHELALGKLEIRESIDLLREYEHINQLRTTFVAAPLKDGRIYTLYGLHRTATGRIASGGEDDEKAGEAATNAQNWPKELRDIVIPEDGNLLVMVDWSRVEWLLTLYFAGDQEGWDRALAGEDVHRRLAAALYGVKYEDVTDEQRTHAKRASHGLNYGMGPQNLADTMGVSFQEARRVLQVFKAAFPIVAKWREAVVEEATRQRYLETPFGWRRWFWSKDPPEMVAFKPSATGACMLKARLPAARVAAHLVGGRLLTTTHDSVLGECWGEHAEAMGMGLKEVFEKPFVSLGGRSFPADVKIGKDWRAVS